ncbi:putative transcription factor NAM family [Helianthus annuus]|uniref:Putative NAC domain-containing protein n=1 Tax=Helianthus annuus TaxID=4232 RepID=A0A251RTN6_HELAN|nr:NAC domain containing protein 50 [Helianthus annuus]KAF5765573.1 putative transcription factor NAM family [Helianthus annuus]KAJ0473981.1 putative transcription factor NAM family [Helianthus annuus]KAJ0845780.1 putative transcription factor NAM family [Helianthus annuus]
MNHEPIITPQQPPPQSSLAPGFRFHPTDEELVRYYLRRKVCGKPFRFQSVSEIDVYKSEPWELADYSQLNSRDQEWYFFSPVDKKYGNGSRLNRATGRGYWKATGKDRSVHHKGQPIGSKKTLVFHVGRAPDGKRTNWVMHEYRLSDQELEGAQVAQDAFVLCRIFEKRGLGPPTKDRYAPFLEEEWEDDKTLFVPGGEPDEDTTNADGTQNDIVQMGTQTIDFVGKRVRSEDENGLKSEPEVEPLSLLNKRLKQADPSSSNANGSDDEPDVETLSLVNKRFKQVDPSSSNANGSDDEPDVETLSLVNKRFKQVDPSSSNANGSDDEPDVKTLSLVNKRFKQVDPSSSNANGSDDSTTTSQDPKTTNLSSALVDFRLPEAIATKETHPMTISSPSFDASTLEKSLHPVYLKYISQLEARIRNESIEKENLKVEVMRAHAMINVLHSRIGDLTKENNELKSGG